MRCPGCQQENPASAKFCNGCGAALRTACPACAHPNPPGSRFCNECGTPLGGAGPAAASPRFTSPETYTPKHLAEKILTSRSGLEGERKLVTVLFADLKGSMELLADRDPEEARQLLDPVLERMMEAVHRYEGTVNQVMGDGIMALFGAPLAHEDHAVRACYAALKMQESVTRYGDEVQRSHGIPLQVRIGLNSGDVVVRTIGSDLHMDYTAVGQTTHLAARMEQMAKPGSVLLTGDTLRLAEGYVQVRPLGATPVKGLDAPIQVYELTGAGPARSRLQAAAGRGLTRFVGRQPELDALRQALERAGAGQGQVVAVVGEPGVGKSRLFWEFIHSHHAHGWLVLESSSVAYGTATAYLPTTDLLKTYFQVEPGEDARRIQEKVTGKLLTLDRALEPTLPAFFDLLDVPVDDRAWQALERRQRHERKLEACKRLLFRESQVQPLCLVVEDLHWVDSETQALLDLLVEGLPTARVLLLVNYRSEYSHGWGSKTYYTQLRVDPLSAAGADELLGTLLGDEPPLAPLKRLLIERAEGNPFFLEECVRTLRETGILSGERGACRLATPLSTIAVPATVQAVLAARIDRLPPEDKAVLQTAAVIGKDVPLTVLQAISDGPEEAVRQSLAHLQAAEFLDESHIFPEVEHSFRHSLTHEVAYGSLLHHRRRALHARVVEAFERLYPERVGEKVHWLAHHAFRGEVWDKALAFLRRTEGAASPPSLDAVPGAGPEIPGHLWWTGDHERAIQVGQRDLVIAREFANFSLKIVANYRLGQAYHSLGDYPRGAEILRRNLEALRDGLIHERFGMAGLASVFSRAWLAWCLAERGEFPEAIVRAEEGVRIADAANHAYTAMVADFGIGYVRLLRRDLAGATSALERGLRLCQTESIPHLFPFLAAPLGAAYALDGRPGDALPLLEHAAEQAHQMNLLANQSRRVGWLAEALALAGQPDRAGPVAEKARALARAHKERGHEAYALRVLGDIAARLDPPDVEKADAAYRDALGLADQLGMRPLAAHCHLGLGRLARLTGEAAGASEQLGRARALFRELGMRPPPEAERAEAP